MLCSECNKNPAILFYKKIENGKESLEGYCYDCAKKKGINPTEVLHDQNNILSNDKININDMTKQFETIFKDLAENINLEDIENLDGAITFESQEQNPDSDEPSKISGAAIPLGSIFSNMFSNKASKSNSDESEELNDGRRKVKVEKKKNKKQNKKKKFLDTFGTNLTDKAKNNELDIVIGREKEIQRIVQILNRRSKNNPCLIGEPGVGKTAIAQGLAIKIANQNVPAKLLNKEVYLLDMTAVIAGTQFRGQFESRMKGIIDECKEYGNIILVIDEIHNIIGAGDGEHSMNAANILKPALSNGEIQLIGTTTLKEYRKYIEKDSALERRFQQVLVEEPNIEDSIVILEGIKKYYEEYHKVKISSDIIRQAVIMSEKYIHDRFLPDKAIDILDEACSRINLENKDLFKLEMLKQELAKVQSEKEEVIAADSTEDYQKAADLKTRECQLIEEIDKLSAKAKPKQLNVQDIANVIESWTKIPVKKITEAETQKLLNLETNLHKRIIGQDEAVSSVARAIRRNRAGLQSTKRPPSFIFVGPTGVGKTELAKSLAYEMFGSEDSIIRIDMSEYMESHSTSKLIGAPPGYVGYDDAGQLTDKVKRKPYSIILLDEIEKAHPDVFNILLQVLDDGKLTDSQGNTVSFSNTIIIMTSNAGSNSNINSIGFGKQSIDKNKIMDSLKELFRPEFLNRVDEIIQFDSLTKEQLLKIVDLMLENTRKALNEKDINMDITKKAKNYLLEKGTDIKFGARPLRRAIQRYIEDELSEMILRSQLLDGQTVKVDFENDKLKFEVK
ncbi:MAG TPA: AAA family ATPase [Clostridiaceae bacterium]|jgi:ATP-dependent Clp protease ATP-binding subunit ClpA|nr:AAA family ATPase [Clostridia bacterium]CDC07068.1 aTPase AAA-2 domain protein [Clostridium sp. CAG:343]HCF34048.1 ATP-dependent Clp protease ATP-binding subunit [Clostridiales bacterium]HJJ19231.1 AAA family ATPase [Clostridiaceae bacterium]MBP8633712.1 AAA family ATPase [Clostridia bacterium]